MLSKKQEQKMIDEGFTIYNNAGANIFDDHFRDVYTKLLHEKGYAVYWNELDETCYYSGFTQIWHKKIK